MTTRAITVIKEAIEEALILVYLLIGGWIVRNPVYQAIFYVYLWEYGK